jgi:Clathrin adaptor complex small chain
MHCAVFARLCCISIAHECCCFHADSLKLLLLTACKKRTHAAQIFHSDRVHYVLDEIIMGGMVLETNINSILTAIMDQNKLHAASMKVQLSTPSGSSALVSNALRR